MTAYDAYGNVATGYTGTVVFTSSDRLRACRQLYVHRGRWGTHNFSITLEHRAHSRSPRPIRRRSITGAYRVSPCGPSRRLPGALRVDRLRHAARPCSSSQCPRQLHLLAGPGPILTPAAARRSRSHSHPRIRPTTRRLPRPPRSLSAGDADPLSGLVERLVVHGTNITFTAVLVAAGTPTGTVTFSDGNTPLATLPLNGSGPTTLPTSGLTVVRPFDHRNLQR